MQDFKLGVRGFLLCEESQMCPLITVSDCLLVTLDGMRLSSCKTTLKRRCKTMSLYCINDVAFLNITLLTNNLLNIKGFFLFY